MIADGPYQVTGGVALDLLRYITNHKGYSVDYDRMKKYPERETYFLCRCGDSKNKPYCDGAHKQVGFVGTETASHAAYDDMAKCIEGKLMDLMDAEELCSVARFCDTKSGTWNLIETAENLDAKDIITHQCKFCPSGRLTAVTKQGERLEPYLPQEISMLEDPLIHKVAPIWVKGGIQIEDANGKPYPVRNRVTLCCCGKSQNKPFCDATHVDE
ncbi:MAG: CDGSH iron-sulfur domain-containing protein [Tannerellaceae bacterium]|nr:CDGSH iron-sulfur domain-containing protein [Tannerellaceae bacterium]